MFSQLFATYLLNNKLITLNELKEALALQSSVHLKLGVLAVNAGFMSAENVNAIHDMQFRVDKKFGELAIEMGFLDQEKLGTLLATQKASHLKLGQALIDKNYMTLEDYERALVDFKTNYSLDEKLHEVEIEDLVGNFYPFKDSDSGEMYKKYISLFIRNLIRFVGEDFRPLESMDISSSLANVLVAQKIKGQLGFNTYLSATKEAFIEFASRFAQENYNSYDEYVKAAAGEFLNVVNGLFIVNVSNNEDIELELSPQTVIENTRLNDLKDGFSIPIEFSFGKVELIVSR